MWVDYGGSLGTVYNDGEISTCGRLWRFTRYSLQRWGDLNMWVDYGGSLGTVYNDGEISTCG